MHLNGADIHATPDATRARYEFLDSQPAASPTAAAAGKQ